VRVCSRAGSLHCRPGTTWQRTSVGPVSQGGRGWRPDIAEWRTAGTAMSRAASHPAFFDLPTPFTTRRQDFLALSRAGPPAWRAGATYRGETAIRPPIRCFRCTANGDCWRVRGASQMSRGANSVPGAGQPGRQSLAADERALGEACLAGTAIGWQRRLWAWSSRGVEGCLARIVPLPGLDIM